MNYPLLVLKLSICALFVSPCLVFAQKKDPALEDKIRQLKVRQMENDDILMCKNMRPDNLSAPVISIIKVSQSSSLKGGKYKVQGVIAGTCLKEGGLYENGERVLQFPLKTTMLYKRFGFEFEVNADNRPEIRVFNVNWLRTTKMALPKAIK